MAEQRGRGRGGHGRDGRGRGGGGAGRPPGAGRRGAAQGSRAGAAAGGRPAPSKPPRVRGSLPPAVANDVRSAARPTQVNEVLALVEDALADLERDRPEPAVRAALRAKEHAPRSGAVREVLGLALYRAGRFRDALRELQAYRRITGRLDQNHLIADCHRALDAPEKAVEPAREALGASLPEEVRAEAAIVAGAALADLGRFEEALSLLRRFRTSTEVARPYDLRVWYVIGDVLERAGQKAEAAEQFRKIMRHDAAAFDAAERLAQLS